jgi:putative SOS response-associated peptidase YedK
MCGRLTLTTSDLETIADLVEAEVDVRLSAAYRPRYNLGPGSRHWIVVQPSRRRLQPARWGIPSAVRRTPEFNTRSEKVSSRPSLRPALEKRRCLVPADGFFEWTGPPKDRRPIWFHARPGQLLLLAGIYQETDGEASFSILTTKPNSLVEKVHDRMPVVLEKEPAQAWLTKFSPDLLAPAPADLLIATPVSARANSIANDDPACLEPASSEPGQAQLNLW